MKKTLLVLAAVAGITSFAQNAQAELITINIGSFGIGGTNGGVSDGNVTLVTGFPISGSDMLIANKYFGFISGLSGDNGLAFASGDDPATPVKFGLNASIGSGSSYFSGNQSTFKHLGVTSPDFGPGSYMGFKTSQGNYGWLEVTWTASSGEFRILSGAYESVAGTPILAGAGPAPIPEPGTWAAMAIFAGGAAYAGWRRRNSAKIPA
jgi:hypothetical protein